MKELLAQLSAAVSDAWRMRWTGLAVAWLVGVIGGVMLARIPDRYEATARVFVDTKSVLRPLMRDLTVDLDIDQTVALLARTLITRPNVEQLMQKAKLDIPANKSERDQFVDSLMRQIRLNSIGRDNLYSFSYSNSDPERARLLVQSLVTMFVDSELGSKQRDSETARNFIDEQIQGYEARLIEAENRRKEFKLKNMAELGGQGKDYFARISALTEDLARLEVELRASEQSRDALKRELSGETASLVPETPAAGSGGETSPEFDARLDAQHKQLDELLRRYTDVHPDVVATRRLIARLEEQRQQDLEIKRKAAAARPPAVARQADPVQQRVRLALAEAEGAVAALRVRATEAQSKLRQLHSAAGRVPQIEAELAQLNRDYEIVRRNYDAFVAQREKASISEDVDATRPARFRIIDPPRTSTLPVFPNRLVLVPAILLLALAAGLAAAYLHSQIRPVFASVEALRRFTNRSVLGAVSMLRSAEDIRRGRMSTLGFASAVAGLVVVFGAWTAWIAVPAQF
jgi:polysaccharide chain length determinant protein (PEP-CTERM system associated)